MESEPVRVVVGRLGRGELEAIQIDVYLDRPLRQRWRTLRIDEQGWGAWLMEIGQWLDEQLFILPNGDKIVFSFFNGGDPYLAIDEDLFRLIKGVVSENISSRLEARS